ncbi:MAG: D-alanine--D-alanine ligase, partial [Planctomycetota bacterium]
DGTLQGLLAAAGRRHTGSGVAASAICMDKAATRGLAQSIGIRVAPGLTIGAHAFETQPAAELERARAVALAGSAWIVKPRRGGSSVNTHLVADALELAPAIERVLASGDDALVEARILGVEVSCAVLHPPGAVARALPAIEIQPDPSRFFDYDQKYSTSGAREICPAPSLTPEQERRVREAALALHGVCGCGGYSRSDFIVPAVGDVVLLEINTLPGLTPRSLLPQEAAVVGISYDELCLWIVESASSSERA